MKSLLPPNATALELALERVVDARVGAITTPLRSLWSADLCPATALPWLAWSLSIDQWEGDWPEALRRARVAAAIPVQRRKGTIAAIRQVVESFGGDFSIREWWQQSPAGTPHTFTLTLALPGNGASAPSAAFVDSVVAEITATKPLRSHFEFVLAQNAWARIGLRAVARPTTYARLALACPADADPPMPNALTLRGYALTLNGWPLTIGS